ncbi:6-phosphogluconolactonase [Paenibacillus algorifonticola]|uniref:6-phosphogluconolactonase n=1 Tax=Paenibacillus algorifonticola TaxID=684063 RepID=A0A1I2D9K7_9BACL|nr:lactonase family protein [Paenibacillus algorifonticola]SFE76813.1 6-phosphogluconolactonase [Paenibacillus algorifonticola]
MSVHNERVVVFVGSYAEAAASGVYAYAFDEKEGKLSLLDEVSGLKNPTFLNVDIPSKRLYAIAEGVSAAGAKIGDAVAFAIDTDKTALTELNRSEAITAPACHIQRDPSNRYLLLSSYHGGRISLVALTDNGEVGELLDIAQHTGVGQHPERQNQPHPHSIQFSPDGRFLFSPDLGIDRIMAYRIDDQAQKLVFHGETVLHAGAGPRHMAFHPNGKFAYVINEVDSTITAFRYDAEVGTLATLATVPTLPSDFDGENTCAEIAVSEDGKYVYGSNRGHDSFVVYAINETDGKLTLAGHVPIEGEHPRHFAFVPGGRYVIAANRDTNNLAVFRVDASTGLPVYTGHSVTVSGPVYVQPVLV